MDSVTKIRSVFFCRSTCNAQLATAILSQAGECDYCRGTTNTVRAYFPDMQQELAHCSKHVLTPFGRSSSLRGIHRIVKMSGVTGSSDEDEDKLRIAHCLSLAWNAPALPTNFRVGAMLVHGHSGTVLSEGYTNELPGNTHAEQVCLMKLLENAETEKHREEAIKSLANGEIVLYTTVEPCVKRLSGSKPCTERILETRKYGRGIAKVYVGVTEPDTFVKKNEGRALLEEAGIEVVHVLGLEEEILNVASAGHTKSASSTT